MHPPLKHRLGFLRAQILTLTRIRSMGFFTRYDYMGARQDVVSSYSGVEELFNGRESEILALLGSMASAAERVAEMQREPDGPRISPQFFPLVDAVAAYALVAGARPRRVIEVGSGFSTFFLARALRDSGGGELTCIDPHPRTSIAALGARLERRMLSERDVGLFDTLDSGDVLFIDSSHIMLEGMDVDILFNRVFPRLRPGVLVHVHDVFLPDPYPATWRSRNYTEQNALIGWLYGGFFEVVFPGYWLVSRHAERARRTFGRLGEVNERASGCLWLRRV